MIEFIKKRASGEDLKHDEAREALLALTSGEVNQSLISSFLTSYVMRPISSVELDGFRQAMLENALPLDLGTTRAIDNCGTGGDGRNTFNISTLSALVAAGAGTPVIKHGNYSATSGCGSSNVLEAMGLKHTSDTSILKKQFDETGFCYIHAPLFHPAMKHVGPVRKELGLKTFFNMLGPLSNPAQPDYQIVGVYDMTVASLYRDVLKNCRKGFTIVHSIDGYDEISLTSNFNCITEDGEEEVHPQALGFPFVKPEEITGGSNLPEAASIFENILGGCGTDAQNAVILINSALAIHTLEAREDFYTALQKAKDSLFGGKAKKVLETIRSIK